MYREYCCGCGLCESVGKSKLLKDEKGFLVPKENFKDFDEFCSKICPSSGVQCDQLEKTNIWGKNHSVNIAYSTNDNIRFKASSGGVLTSLCCYLIDNKKVDAIIHTGEDKSNPIATVTLCSESIEEILNGCGSRYSSSTPLKEIEKYLETGKKYAFIGKPCDVTALRNYSRIDKRINESFIYMFSFFCAGAPSERANLLLLEKMGCNKEECSSLTYRGNGWPGYATGIDKNGEHKLLYKDAWGETLGRDIRLMCRFCLDGIGELADISCGDAWKLDENMKPIFEESDGQNVVFCRSDKGEKLFREACSAGYIFSKIYENYENELKYSQAYQFQRRATMNDTINALKLYRKPFPNYDKKVLKSYSKNLKLKSKFKRFYGTIKRLKEGKLGI